MLSIKTRDTCPIVPLVYVWVNWPYSRKLSCYGLTFQAIWGKLGLYWNTCANRVELVFLRNAKYVRLCLCVHISQKLHCLSVLVKFSCCHCSALLKQHCNTLYTSHFVSDFMFSQNGLIGSCFHKMGSSALVQIKMTNYMFPTPRHRVPLVMKLLSWIALPHCHLTTLWLTSHIRHIHTAWA